MTYNPKWLENSPDAQLGGFDGATGADTVVPTQKAVKSFIYDMQEDVKDPSGIANRSATAIGYDTTSTVDQCTVYIEPNGEDVEVYLSGKKYVFDTRQSVTLPDTEGMHYIYFNASGTLTTSTAWNPNIILEWAFVAVVYWNATSKEVVYFGDERHGIDMAGATHYNLHNAQGTVYVNGLALANISVDSTSATDADAQLSVESGTILDEDIVHSISANTFPANLPIYYLSGSASDWRKLPATAFPVDNTVGTGRVAWNQFTGGAWQRTEATDGYFVLTHIFATNDVDNPVIVIMGQAEYATYEEAKDGAENEINTIVQGGLAFQEFLAIGTVIFWTNDIFANTPKAIILSTNSGGDYQDWRSSGLSPAAGSPADHGQLSGLSDDDHTQYAILSALRAFTGEQEFASGINISSGDLTVASGTNVVVGATNVANFTADAQVLGVSGDTLITTTQSTDVIDFSVAGGSVATFESDGLTLASGTNVNEFSTDTTLADDSDNAVPTEHAVKTYVDTAISSFASNRIYQGDSQVIVNDATAAGEVRVITDGVDVANFSTTAVRLGDPSTSNGMQLTVDSESGFFVEDNLTAYIYASNSELAVGRPTDSLYFDILHDLVRMTVGGELAGVWTSGYQSLGSPFDVGPYPGGSDKVGFSADHTGGRVIMAASDQNYLIINDSTSVTTTGTTMKYYDQGIEHLSINTDAFYVGDIAQNENYFGMINVLSDPDFLVATSTGTKIQVNATFQRFGSYFGGHIQMAPGETYTTAIYTDDNENVGARFNNTNQEFGAFASTRMVINQTSDNIVFTSTSTTVGTFAAAGLTLQNGTNINEFSTDGTLSGDSNDAVPTEQAVKTYVDNAIGGAVDHNSTTGKQGGDSTSDEFYHVIADVFNQIYATSSSVSGVGDSASSNVEVDNSTNTVTIDANATEVASFTSAIQQIGLTGDTFVSVNQTANTVSITAGNESQILVETTGTTVYDDLIITGNLFVDGTTFVVNNQEVTTSDNIIVINNGEVGPGVTSGRAGIEVDRGSLDNYFFIFDEVTDTFRIGASDGTSFVDLQAVATREDSPTNMVVPYWNDTDKRFDTVGNDSITVNNTAHTITFAITSTQATIDTNGLTLSTGASVNEFSIDGTLSGDSNDAVPTEAAVKTYVDNAIASFSGNKISDGDSFVIVNDSTGGAGEVRIVVDGVEVGYYDAQATSQRLGKVDGGNITTSDSSITANENTVAVLYLDETTQRFGITSGTSFTMNQTADTHSFTANGASVMTLAETEQVFGDSTATSSIVLDQSGDTVTIQNNVTATAVFAATSQTIGQAADSRVVISQSADTVAIYGANTLSGTFSTSGLTLASGATVNAFSTDTALGTSNTVVPTQNAVKTYVDNAIGGVDNIRFVSSDTTAVAGDIVLVDSTAAPVNIELIESADGKITVKKITNDSNTVTIFTSPGTIDGHANVTIDTPYQAYGFISDASNFYII